jgi:hypothetical protein
VAAGRCVVSGVDRAMHRIGCCACGLLCGFVGCCNSIGCCTCG